MCVPGRSVSSPGCLRRSPLLRRSLSPAHCWITRAVSAIRCVMNTPGSIPPAAGLTGACVIGSTRTATRWSSWTFLIDPTPTAHERSALVAGNWLLYRLIASWSLRGSREHARENARRPAEAPTSRLEPLSSPAIIGRRLRTSSSFVLARALTGACRCGRSSLTCGRTAARNAAAAGKPAPPPARRSPGHRGSPPRSLDKRFPHGRSIWVSHVLPDALDELSLRRASS